MNSEFYKNKLLTRQTELSERLERVERHIKHRDGPLSADFAEQATERQNDEVVFSLDDSLTIELQEVRAALKRVETGEFGICTACGREIESARIDAIPHTLVCVNCKELV